MKFVFYWFLLQLVFISAFGNMNSASLYKEAIAHGVSPSDYYNLTMSSNCRDSNGFIGFIGGLLVPLADTPLVKGEWCWDVN